MLQAIYHGAALAVMVNGYLQLQQTVAGQWISNLKGGHVPFLTIQGLTMSCLTCAFAFLADVLPSVRFFSRARRHLLMIAMPLEVVIASIYWSLLIFSPKLLITQGSDSDKPQSPEVFFMIPLHIDMALHAAPGTFLILHFFLFEKKYTDNEKKYDPPAMVTLFSAWYVCCVEFFAKLNNFWPYPFLDVIFPLRFLIYCGALSIALLSFYGLNALHP